MTIVAKRIGGDGGWRARPPCGAVLLFVALLVLVGLVGCVNVPTVTPSGATIPPTSTAEITLLPTRQAVPPTMTVVSSPTSLGEPMPVGSLRLSEIPEPGRYPSGVVMLDGRVYVCNRSTNNVSIVEGSRVVKVIPVGREPSCLVAHPPTGQVFVLNEGEATISVIRGRALVDTWRIPERGVSLAIMDDRLWVGTMRGGTILQLSLTDGRELGRTQLSTANTVLRLVPNVSRGEMLVATYGRVHVVGVAPFQERKSAAMNSYRTLGVSPAGDAVYVSAYDSEERQNYLLYLSAQDLALQARILVPWDTFALAIDPASGHVYVVSSYSNELLAIDASLTRVLARRVVGLSPRAMALDTAQQLLYVANGDGDNLAVLRADTLALVSIVPLADRLEDMVVDAQTGRLYVASGGRDQVLIVEGEALVDQWDIGPHPSLVRPIPSRHLVAVYTRADRALHFLDRGGAPVHRYELSHAPASLALRSLGDRLYAGGTVVELSDWTTRTLRVPTVYGSEVPIKVVEDTLRGQLYAVAFNGIPGSNGGYVVRRLDAEDDRGSCGLGRLSVIDIVYDETMDRFYTTNARMGTFGLQVADAADCREVSYLSLRRYPGAMALNPSTHHLWLVLGGTYGAPDARESMVLAYDTRTWGRVAEWPLQGEITSLAVDSERNRVYLGDDATGIIHIVQDVEVPPPPAPTRTYTVTPWPTWTPEPQPRATATPVPTPTSTPTVTCSYEVSDELLAAWQALGGLVACGCPLDDGYVGFWAVQLFERGRMFWQESGGTIYVLLDDGRLAILQDEWQEGMPDYTCQADAPPDRHLPVRGFGLVWCREEKVREALGWATGPERGFQALYQPFEHGPLMRDETGVVWSLRSDGSWGVVGP